MAFKDVIERLRELKEVMGQSLEVTSPDEAEYSLVKQAYEDLKEAEARTNNALSCLAMASLVKEKSVQKT